MKNITQSLIKELEKYNQKKVCGLQLKAKYYDNIQFPPSDVQLLGQWFEYKATGQKNRDGEIPEAPTLKNGNLPKKYKDILEHIEPFNKMISDNNFEIIETGKRLIHRGLQGDVDLVLKDKITNKIVFGDIKTTGLINDKWNEFGWDEDSLQFKHNLMIQAIHYKLLGILEYEYEPDFYFFLFSNTNTVERKIYKITLNDNRLEEHLAHVERIYQIKLKAEKEGYKAYPNTKECSKCAIKDTCNSFTNVPLITDIYY
tara:strand:- start:1617 stop:2387 length:771 start_codon:yes stop_codon:yes gene_type:complete